VAERATVAQVIQLGMENPSGTAVAATKLVSSFNLDGGIKAENIPFRGGGRKYSSFVVPNKEWSEWKISGQATYGEIVYLLNSILTVTNPVADTTLGKKWTFTPALSAEDTVKTYTVEIGSPVRAMRFAYGIVSELGLKFSRSTGVEIDGTMLGTAITDDHTLTAGCAAIEAIPIPMTGKQLDFYVADSWAGLAGASSFARCLSAEWRISNRFSPLWVIASANGSWVAHVETVPQVRLKVLVEADSAGMAFLTLMRAATPKWGSLKAVGATIESGKTYLFQHDGAYNVLNASDFRDQDGVYAIEWELEAVYDSTATKTYEVTVRNLLAAL
jgi:hypothetical protein